MVHKWSTRNETHTLIHADDSERVLAYVGERNGKFLLRVPWLGWDGDIGNFEGAYICDTLQDAKQSAEEEIQRRIAEIT
jgi:hypothetical protein